MNRIAFFGGTGGLGKQLIPLLSKDYKVTAIGSKDVDITNREQVFDFFAENDFEVVINFSAFNYDSFLHKLDMTKTDKVKTQLDVNILGNVNILSACLPMMRKNNFGRVIGASSILSSRPIPGTSLYSASKSFIETLYKTASLENCSKNITCNTIQLGYFDGGLAHKIPEEIRNKIVKSIPSKRLGSIEELNLAIRFLLGVSYMNGEVLNINGGLN